MTTVSIVGAGPGAPDLLTRRAENRLQSAQVLIWTDSLVSPQIAALAPDHCETIRSSTLTLEDVLPLMIDRAKKGLQVVRLHDGDPCLYGALSEQICGLNDAGISVDVVPGISAYQATASALGAELTIPGLVQTIVLGGLVDALGFRKRRVWRILLASRHRSASTSVLAMLRRYKQHC